MKKLVLLTVGVIAAVLPLAGCASSSEVTASLGQAFEVPIHHAASLPAEGLQLTFQAVTKDSRCPTGVQCVTAGEADYTVRITKGDFSASLAFNELGGGGFALATFLDYSVNASLLPYPETPDGIPPEDYRVRLTITHPPIADALPEDDMAGIYAGVIRQLLTKDNSFGTGSPGLSTVYLVYTASDTTPIERAAPPEPHLLAATLRDKISSRLADLSYVIHWVPGRDSLSFEGTGRTVAGGGVVISLGNIHPGENGTYQAYAGMYFSNLAGTGRVYIVKKVSGTWQVTGDTGVIWTS